MDVLQDSLICNVALKYASQLVNTRQKPISKNVKFVSLALVIVTLLAVAAPALALSGSFVPYLGGTGSSYNIRRGHSGPQVKNHQMLLNATLYKSLALDGIFGSGTEDAVEEFQRDFMGSSEVDGIVGGKTKEALWSICDVWPNLIEVY